MEREVYSWGHLLGLTVYSDATDGAQLIVGRSSFSSQHWKPSQNIQVGEREGSMVEELQASLRVKKTVHSWLTVSCTQ